MAATPPSVAADSMLSGTTPVDGVNGEVPTRSTRTPSGSMSRGIVLRKSSPFRVGLTVAACNLIIFTVAGCIFYNLFESRLIGRIDESIALRFAQINSLYEARGLDALLEMGRVRDDLPMSSSMGFHLATSQGVRLAGNVPICITEPGWAYLQGSDLGLDSNHEFRFFTGNVGGNLLSLGRSLDQVAAFRATALYAFLWTFLSCLLLAVISALFIAYRTHCRIAGIAQSLDKVAGGNLDARIPVSRHGDDIDELAGHINGALERLKQMVESLGQVSNDIAHDLKTPLNRLFIHIEEAAMRTRAGQRVDDELDVALKEAQTINGTFEALLRIAQIEAGARRAQFLPVDLMPVLETVAEVYEPVVEENQQTLRVNVNEARRLPMIGDRELLMQLLVNLVENAIRHCPQGSCIDIEAGRTESGVWVCVADNGPGVPAEAREKIFQRLYRLESSRTTEGTGLGLSLVKAIAELHCGTISLADNHPGLRFTVSFDRDCECDPDP